MKKTITLIALVLTTFFFTSCKKEEKPLRNWCVNKLNRVEIRPIDPTICTGYLAIGDEVTTVTGEGSWTITTASAATITQQQYNELKARLDSGNTSAICLQVKPCF